MQYILDGSIAPNMLQEIAITMRAHLGSARDAHVSLPVPSRNSHLPLSEANHAHLSQETDNCSRASRAGSALPVADAVNNNNRRLRSRALLGRTLPAHA
jgi:hypothetical protein